MNITAERVATVQDEYDHALTDQQLWQIAMIARTAPSGRGDHGVDRVLFTDGTRLTRGELIDTYADQHIDFVITGLGIFANVLGWQPLPEDDEPRPLQEVLDEHCAQVRAQREPKSRRKSAQERGPWGPEGRPESPEALR